MKENCFKGGFCASKGFTLIELLVVVLIIGILAAVAVPQYHRAVVKSRVAAILPVLDSIRSAQETYYLSNGSYTSNTEELDINAPADCILSAGKAGRCGTDFHIDFGISLAKENPQMNAHYCPGTTNWTQCEAAIDFTIVYFYPRANRFIGTGRVCAVRNHSAFGESICKSLSKTGAPDYDDGNGNNRYYF